MEPTMLSGPRDIAMLLAGVSLTVWVIKSLRNGRGHQSEQGSATPIYTEMLSQMRQVATSLTLVVERLNNLPTRAEVFGDLRTNIRHDIGNKIQPIATDVEGVLSELKEIRRQKGGL